ncbi:hypothetical protein ACTMTI_20025 [Nonomuraea sp. H19]|uniref:hypothetical protein n=1 Tax=Nonomuraea sp. H19 TaxID=3452206 RepID=UPI003F8BB82F
MTDGDGGDTVHLGDDADLVALYEMAVGVMLLPALAGFFQSAAAVKAPGLRRGPGQGDERQTRPGWPSA